MTGRCLGIAIACVLAAEAVALAQPLPYRADRLEQWLDAVRQHEPGMEDAALLTVASWSISDVRTLWTQIELLIQQMRGRNRFTFTVGRAGPSVIANTRAALIRPVLVCAAGGRLLEANCLKMQPSLAVPPSNLLALSNSVDAGRRAGDGDNYILRRGALLHADVAMLVPPTTVEPPGGASPLDP